ncbi:MAG: hypothetical protein U0835_17455 [Isosphaeraceae bacterium]
MNPKPLETLVQIDRIVLPATALAGGDAESFRARVAEELTRRLEREGLGEADVDLEIDADRVRVSDLDVDLEGPVDERALARAIARVIAEAVRRPGRNSAGGRGS